MDESSLSRLPAELRDRIYEFVVRPEREHHISITVRSGTPVTKGLDLRFMRSCRQLKQEATPVFYSANSFTIVTKYLEIETEAGRREARKPFVGLEAWLAAIGPENANHLSRVCIDLGWFGVEADKPDVITGVLNLAREEILLLNIPRCAVVLRAAYFIEVFPPIGHIMRYIDIPVSDRQVAEQMLESTTSTSREKMPPYTFNRELVNHTLELFKNGIFAICSG